MITSLLIKAFTRLKRLAKNNPVSLFLRKTEFNQHFATANRVNLFRGVFNNFEQAVASAPKTKKIGYDNPEPAEMYRERMNHVYPSDYPALFWLDRLLKSHHSIFDLGGHIGVSYYSYKKYLNYSEDLSWQVCDVPSVVNSAKEVAKKHDSTGLSFTTDYNDISKHEILFASGSLQYIEEPLSSIIDRQSTKPLHILVNMLPLCDYETFVTLQSIGTVYCPYIIFNKEQFVNSITELGYELIDIWENPEKACTIAFREDKSLDHYYGLYFKRNS